MKKYLRIFVFSLIVFFMPIYVNASNGKLKSDSIIECSGVKYGYHGNDKHYHKAILKNNEWYADGEIITNINDICADDSEYIETKSTTSVDTSNDENTSSTDSVDRDIVTLKECVDGDTAHFKLGNKTLKVRFLAINTPESTTKEEFYGKEASEYVCNKLYNASKIELEYDEESDKLDKYGRTLAWIIVDNENLQLDLVKNGYAEVKYIYGDYKYLDELKKLEKEAKKQKLGMWKDYEDTIDYQKYIYIGIGIVLIIILLMCKNKKGAKKVFNKVKKKL